jgi:hypothetical protein
MRRFRDHVPSWTQDCVLSGPMKKAENFIAGGWLNDIDLQDAMAQPSGVEV